MCAQRQFVFGPVSSRRLGRSLGIDLVAHKTCAWNCVYCQLGRTTQLTLARSEYVPVDAVLAELRTAFDEGIVADYVTISGSGEPTLHQRLADVVRGIREITRTPIAMLTSGATLWDPEVRADCALADVILPTLAAHNEDQYRCIHRPAPSLTFARHLDGLIAMARQKPPAMWIELFLIEGFNAGDDDLTAFLSVIRSIAPAKIQINTAVRPSAETYARSVPTEKLRRWREALGPTAEVLVPHVVSESHFSFVSDDEIVSLCLRHPCTAADVAVVCGCSPESAENRLARLRDAGRLRIERRGEHEFFLVH